MFIASAQGQTLNFINPFVQLVSELNTLILFTIPSIVHLDKLHYLVILFTVYCYYLSLLIVYLM